MLGQSSKMNKFTNNNEANNNNNNSQMILKRIPIPHANLILNQPMENSFKLNDSIIQDCCVFTSEQNGYFHISAQVCVSNISSIQTKCSFFQFGICDKNNMETQCKENMRSNICNTIVDANYIISETMSCIMQLEAGITYSLWLNIGSDNATNFLFEAENSNLRLYKL